MNHSKDESKGTVILSVIGNSAAAALQTTCTAESIDEWSYLFFMLPISLYSHIQVRRKQHFSPGNRSNGHPKKDKCITEEGGYDTTIQLPGDHRDIHSTQNRFNRVEVRHPPYLSPPTKLISREVWGWDELKMGERVSASPEIQWTTVQMTIKTRNQAVSFSPSIRNRSKKLPMPWEGKRQAPAIFWGNGSCRVMSKSYSNLISKRIRSCDVGPQWQISSNCMMKSIY